MAQPLLCKDCKHFKRYKSPTWVYFIPFFGQILLAFDFSVRNSDGISLGRCQASPKESNAFTGANELQFASNSRAFGPCGPGGSFWQNKR